MLFIGTSYLILSLFIFYYQLIADTMNYQSISSPSIKFSQTDPNAEINDLSSEGASSKSGHQNKQSESIISKSRPLVRKPNHQNNNLESYKSIKRKSKQKVEVSSLEAPPKCPKPRPQSGQSSSAKGNSSQFGSSLGSAAVKTSVSEEEEMVKFKKKALSKKQIIELKNSLGAEADESQVNSEAGTEKPVQNREMEPFVKQNKKSKTQYFYIEDFQKQTHGNHGQADHYPQEGSQTEREFIVSLKQKCKSVDENNSLLQKRITWLREEVEMHLQRELCHEREKAEYEKRLVEKERELREMTASFTVERDWLKSEVKGRDLQIERLKELFIALHNKFDSDRQIMEQEIELMKGEREGEEEERARGEERARRLEEQVLGLIEEKKQLQFRSVSACEQYSQSFIEKLINENKYLKVENHTLSKCKEEVMNSKKELKRVANERDSLKKKIIESARREIRKFRSGEEDSDSSSFFKLSDISTPSSFRES